MPIENGVGYGEYTGVKIEHLSKIIAMHLAVTQAVIKKHASYYELEYRYVDLTAGKGSTPDGTMGSPIVFLTKASDSKFDIPFRADLIEREPKNIEELEKTISARSTEFLQQGKIYYHPDDYEKVIPNLFKTKKDFELGLVYVDPTGTKDLPDINTLARISNMRPRMEILFYLSATGVKRQFQQTHKLLEDFLNATGKQHWLIRKPIKGDKHQWTFLLGSNSDLFKPYRSIRSYFYLLNSPEGQQVFEKMNLSQDQRIEQKQPRFDGF
ncbi:MAG: three-Cys-motif partner protein TcmP [Anaerolineales bacterium]|jgi:three-Cys-motif partner protein|nr:three-Cys-motif partner protein TcmP [Anaerolineales bacterium]